jgi:hypothetical protein
VAPSRRGREGAHMRARPGGPSSMMRFATIVEPEQMISIRVCLGVPAGFSCLIEQKIVHHDSNTGSLSFCRR